MFLKYYDVSELNPISVTLRSFLSNVTLLKNDLFIPMCVCVCLHTFICAGVWWVESDFLSSPKNDKIVLPPAAFHAISHTVLKCPMTIWNRLGGDVKVIGGKGSHPNIPPLCYVNGRFHLAEEFAIKEFSSDTTG